MPFFAFRENRTGKVKTIFASDEIEAIENLTIYPWVYTLIDVRFADQSPVNDKTPASEMNVPALMEAKVYEYSQKQRYQHIEKAAI